VDETAIINASPLIFLARAEQLDLLSQLVRRVLVPEPVASEISRRGNADVTARALQNSPVLSVVPVSVVPRLIEQWGLGDGESAVLALAQATP
jgi:predicted nucleic acid-binding protein